jgi:hypothetical protein
MAKDVEAVAPANELLCGAAQAVFRRVDSKSLRVLSTRFRVVAYGGILTKHRLGVSVDGVAHSFYMRDGSRRQTCFDTRTGARKVQGGSGEGVKVRKWCSADNLCHHPRRRNA